MKFTPIDRTTWERNSHYDYYTNLLKCGYSVTVSLDITKLHQQVKEDLQRRKSRKGKTGTATELLLYLHGAVVKLYWLFRLHRERNPDAVSNYYLR